MKPMKPLPPPKPVRSVTLQRPSDYSRDSGISVTDEPSPTPSIVPDSRGGVRQLASRFESISLRQSGSTVSARGPEQVPGRQVKQTTNNNNNKPVIPPKPLHYTGLSATERALFAQRANQIAERIYDTVCERYPPPAINTEEERVTELHFAEELEDPTSTDGYSSFESSSENEDETYEPEIPVSRSSPSSPSPSSPVAVEQDAHEQTHESHRLQQIIDEMLEKEQKYIENLAHGIRRYIPAMYSQNLPTALRGQKNTIFVNLEEIWATHRDHFLPDLNHAADLTANHTAGDVVERIAQTFLDYIEGDRFYCYIRYAMHQPEAELLVMRYSDYFLKIQNDLGDQLGLNSLLLQPIQRLPRYKLLLNEMVKDLLKDKDGMRTMNRRTALLCKVDKRLSNFIERVNQAINIRDIRQLQSYAPATVMMSALTPSSDVPLVMILQPEGNRNPDRDTPINLLYQGRFRRLFLLDIYDTNVRRRYSGKLFAFEKLLLYVELVRDRMEYRGHYFDTELCHSEDGRNRIVLCAGTRGTQEIIVQSETNTEIQSLLALLHSMTRAVIYDEVNEATGEDQLQQYELEDDDDDDVFATSSTNGTDAEDQQEAWDEQRLTVTLVEAQQQFLEVLVANRRFYLDTLTVELKIKLAAFISAFEAILNLHNQILEDLSHPATPVGPNEICQCFLRYLKTDHFASYFDYLREFRKAIKWIQNGQRPSNFNNRVASTVEQFTFLCIEHLQEFNRYFEALIIKYSDDSSLNVPINTELFQQLAFAQVRLNAFRVNLGQTYKLYLLDERIPSYGPLIYDDRASLYRPLREKDAGLCRMFICRRATICVKIKLEESDELEGTGDRNKGDPSNKEAERLLRIVFVDRFGGRGTLMRMRQSKRHSQRLNFVLDGLKFRIDFDSKECKKRFFDRHVHQYAQ
ncbi:uncharacterized protein LOC126574555 [Anopheles aquasalis]|uniref:uncharacterized protein LOC126574555 n=1 Tax=Anopheles aquasalis TaxID=42839 RepID=UPI00215A5639|nr:uncharacterized protein LOC126574555 [Anopheles aquasalis]